VVTQNVDDLHERAGTRALVRLHGSLFAPRCVRCAAPASLPPPSCVECDGPVRPGVVWFGESLPEDQLAAAVRAASTCDLLLTVGTSAVVYPAAEIPRVAARHGAPVVQVNPYETPLDALADINLRGPAGQVLPALVAAAWPDAGGAR
jgi:NAD-dependent deacetylase